MHVSATFACTTDAHCLVGGSFFFEPQLQPQAFSVGDVVQLVGIEMQEWNGSAQLSGRNVHIVEVVSGNRKGRCPAFLYSYVFCYHMPGAGGRVLG
jgi:hypothetical protein